MIEESKLLTLAKRTIEIRKQIKKKADGIKKLKEQEEGKQRDTKQNKYSTRKCNLEGLLESEIRARD